MLDPADLRADLEIQSNDTLMRIVALCKEILHTRTGRVHQQDVTAVIHAGKDSHFPQPFPTILLVTPTSTPSPLQGEWLRVSISTYFPQNRSKG